MAELWYGFFDSTAQDPRELTASDWARFFASFLTDGIRNGGTCLEVTANTGMTVKVDNGIANILGYIIELKTDLTGRYYNVVVPAAHPQYPRIDRLVLRLDRDASARIIKPVILMGTAAATPIAPALTRNAKVWELSLAQIRVNANAVTIPQANITNERFSTTLCGMMNSVLGLDPSAWQRQFDTFIDGYDVDADALMADFKQKLEQGVAANQSSWNTWRDANQSGWYAWFATIKVDLQQYTTFNFDNIAALGGVTKTLKIADGKKLETIVITGNGVKVAEREMTFATLTTMETVYKADGVGILREVEMKKVIENGMIKDVIV